jgi:hypothetical protein
MKYEQRINLTSVIISTALHLVVLALFSFVDFTSNHQRFTEVVITFPGIEEVIELTEPEETEVEILEELMVVEETLQPVPEIGNTVASQQQTQTVNPSQTQTGNSITSSTSNWDPNDSRLLDSLVGIATPSSGQQSPPSNLPPESLFGTVSGNSSDSPPRPEGSEPLREIDRSFYDGNHNGSQSTPNSNQGPDIAQSVLDSLARLQKEFEFSSRNLSATSTSTGTPDPRVQGLGTRAPLVRLSLRNPAELESNIRWPVIVELEVSEEGRVKITNSDSYILYPNLLLQLVHMFDGFIFPAVPEGTGIQRATMTLTTRDLIN